MLLRSILESATPLCINYIRIYFHFQIFFFLFFFLENKELMIEDQNHFRLNNQFSI